MMRALVTGAGGFVGRHLCASLDTRGVEVRTIGPRPTSAAHLTVDPIDLVALTAAVDAARPTAVFHLAGVRASADPTDYYRVNAAFAAGLLAALERSGQAGVPVLLVGSAAEYGPIGPASLPVSETMLACPMSDYGISKLAQTHLGLAAAARGRPVVVVRPFNIIGPGMPTDLAVGSFAAQVAAIVRGDAPPTLRVGNLASARDFIDVRDVVRLFVALLAHPRARGRVVNVCTGVATAMRTVVADLIALAGMEIAVEREPSRVKETDSSVHYGSTALLNALLGPLAPRPVDASLREVLAARLSDMPPRSPGAG